jgi:ABC-2 type transport system permease protein
MAFRMDFFFRIFMDIIYYAVNLAFYNIIYMHTTILGGWDLNQMMVFVAGYLVLDAVVMTFFANNLWRLPQYVNNGDLDYYLIRPVSSLFFLSLRDFAANSFINLTMTWAIFIWILTKYPYPFELFQLALFIAMLFCGIFLYYLVRMATIIPVFWTLSARGFDQLFWGVSRFLERPDRIFTGWVRRILASILPFSIMASYPARIFLDGFSWNVFWHIVIVTFCFWALVVVLWHLGLRAYSSASS